MKVKLHRNKLHLKYYDDGNYEIFIVLTSMKE